MSKATKPYPRKSRGKQARSGGSFMVYVVLGIIVVVVIAIAVNAVQTANGANSVSSTGVMGTPIAVDSRQHIPTDQVPGPYTNPPSGGAHFPVTFPAKFYQETDIASLPAHPEGYLVHNLEHGYVIFWYNCQANPAVNCANLKKAIQNVMDTYGGVKLIAFPWPALDVPLAMSSWGQIYKLAAPDEKIMRQFVTSNRFQAPEPNGQ